MARSAAHSRTSSAILIATLLLGLATAGCDRFRKSDGAAGGIEELVKAAEKNPSFENYTTLGLAYGRAGRHEDALKAFQKSAQISPRSSIAHNNVCAEHNALKQWDQAIAACEKSLQLEPGFKLAAGNLAFARKSRGTASALPEDRILDEGMEQYKRGAYREAIATWKKIEAASPRYPTALNNIASAHILLKEFDAADKALAAALKAEPTNPLFLNNQRWLATERKK